MGFKYVDYTNVDYTTEEVTKFDEGGWKCNPELGRDHYQGVLVNEESKECTTLISFSLKKQSRTAYPTGDQCVITDKNWVAYEYQEKPEIYGYIINTPFGECINLDTDTCCQQLGLTNVGRNLVATPDNRNDSSDIVGDKLKKSNIIPIIIIAPIIVILVIVLWFFLIKQRQK